MALTRKLTPLTGLGRSAGAVAAVPPPLQVSGLALWLDASAIVGLSDNDPVATWSDGSGLGNHAAQSNSVNRPTYKTGILNANPVVRFNGSSGYMIVPNHSSINPQTITILAVFTPATVGILQGILGKCTGIWSDLSYSHRLNTNSYDFITDPDLNVVSSATANTSPHIITLKSDGSNKSIRRDGTSLASGAYANNLGSSTSSLFIGAYAGGSGQDFLFYGDIAEILIYPSLSTGDIEFLESYLGDKYGITVP